ncbi:unnamed protein product [Protopolystoma xenopodis]|uniref:Uncharacterized protein n=1 Tax=Protopolystoma xenopodis TaxID=117903 RepID=A0A448WHX1_9PLAT|nr:unnamed protein product [Protopolystoma xenopodis]
MLQNERRPEVCAHQPAKAASSESSSPSRPLLPQTVASAAVPASPSETLGQLELPTIEKSTRLEPKSELSSPLACFGMDTDAATPFTSPPSTQASGLALAATESSDSAEDLQRLCSERPEAGGAQEISRAVNDWLQSRPRRLYHNEELDSGPMQLCYISELEEDRETNPPPGLGQPGFCQTPRQEDESEKADGNTRLGQPEPEPEPDEMEEWSLRQVIPKSSHFLDNRGAFIAKQVSANLQSSHSFPSSEPDNEDFLLLL